MILGITGGTGCGKTTLLELIAEQGGTVLDCDAIYHRLLQTDPALLAAIEKRFPGTVNDGILDRKKLGGMVFPDNNALLELNQITHKAVKQQVLLVLENKPELAAIDAIGLFEGALAPLCDVTVAITAPRETRIRRLMERDGITREYATKRIDAQRDAQWFAERCDYILENNATREQFRRKCLVFLQDLGIIKTEITS